MTYKSCPKPQPCEATFKAFYLGDVHSDQYIDAYEGIRGAESASKLNGMTFGGPGDALAGNIIDLTVTDDAGRNGRLDGENFWGNYDTFKSSKPVEVPIRGTNDVKYEDTFKFDGTAQYTATITYTDGTTATTRVTVIQDTLGRSFMVPNEDGSGGNVINAKPIQSVTLGKAIKDCDNNYNYCPPDDWHPIPCFTAGVRLMTAKGQRPVEKIAVGDLVQTADHGFQPVRWIGSRRLDAIDLATAPQLLPVRICRGALGDGLPKRDLLVSPQHRMLVRSAVAHELFGAEEVLVAAKHLVGLSGVEIATDLTEVTYLHLLFDDHQVVFAEGAESESLYTGGEALKSVGEAARTEILALFPELGDGAARPGARPFLTGRQGRDLAARHEGVALQ